MSADAGVEPSLGAVFPVGLTPVAHTAANVQSTATAMSTVEVNDTQSPTPSDVPAHITVNAPTAAGVAPS